MEKHNDVTELESPVDYYIPVRASFSSSEASEASTSDETSTSTAVTAATATTAATADAAPAPPDEEERPTLVSGTPRGHTNPRNSLHGAGDGAGLALSLLKFMQRVKMCERMITEVEAQRDEALKLLARSQAKLTEYQRLYPMPGAPAAKTTPGDKILTKEEAEERKKQMEREKAASRQQKTNDWILGNWRACKGPLTYAEYLYERHHYQQALAELDKLLAGEARLAVATATATALGAGDSRPAYNPTLAIDCQLLKARVLARCNRLPEAMELAEDAAQVATTHGLYQLRSKSLFHLGTFHYEDCRFTDARLLFTMAKHSVSTPDQDEAADAWKEKADVDAQDFQHRDRSVVSILETGNRRPSNSCLKGISKSYGKSS